MKYIYIWLLVFFSMLAVIAIGVYGCGDKPTVVNPPKPTVRVVPDSEFCAAIASPFATSRATGTKGKYWPQNQTIQVGFIGGTATKRKYVADAFALWAELVNLKITYPAAGPYKIRIAFVSGGGSWSYIGTDCQNVAQNSPTMNIGWSGLDVCIHEIGHALGASHEQGSPNSDIQWNKEVVYAALGGPPNNWSRATVDWNVFRKLTPQEADATVFDPLSIMQYSVPGSWTYNYPNGIPGGKMLSTLDKSFWAAQYPKNNPPPPPPPPNGVTITAAQRNNIKRITNKVTAANNAAKLASDSLNIIINQIFQ